MFLIDMFSGTNCGWRYHSIVKSNQSPKTIQLFPRLLGATLAAVLCALAITAAPSVSTAQNAQNLPSLGDTEREYLSPVAERKLGDAIMQDIQRNRDYLDDAPLLEYLNNFGDDLLTVYPEARGDASYDYFFFAVRDPMLNAFALPGGNIGVHSALMLAAQSESELASVMAHEIGHVSQRHIARMLGQQSRDSLIPIASALLAILASNASPDASMAILASGQGIAIQRQLSFSRDAEREADRVGFEILNAAHFDTSGMVAFFGRMQTATRSYSDVTPPYLRSHPMTTERIADIQGRIREQRYKQHVDSLDFHVIRARVRVLQDESNQGLHETSKFFDNQLLQKNWQQTAAAQYGLALIALKREELTEALTLLQKAIAAQSVSAPTVRTPLFDSLAIDIHLTAKRPADALKEAISAHERFPLSQGISRQYADALIAAGRYDDASQYLREQTQLYRSEPKLYSLLAKSYAAQSKVALQHMALAESYALSGGLQSALDQFALARRAPDASFYDQAVIDAREREVQTRRKEALEESKKGR